MVLRSQPSTAAEIGTPQLMLPHDDVRAVPDQPSQQEVTRKVAVSNDHVARSQARRQCSGQGRLPGTLAFAGTSGPFQCCAARRVNDRHQAFQGKLQPRPLVLALGKFTLVRQSIRQGECGAVDRLDLPATPALCVRLVASEPFTYRVSEPFDQVPRHRVLATLISPQDLLDEERQGLQRTIDAFAMSPAGSWTQRIRCIRGITWPNTSPNPWAKRLRNRLICSPKQRRLISFIGADPPAL